MQQEQCNSTQLQNISVESLLHPLVDTACRTLVVAKAHVLEQGLTPCSLWPLP